MGMLRSLSLPLQKETLPLRPPVCLSLHLSGDTCSRGSRLLETKDWATPTFRSTRDGRDRILRLGTVKIRITARIRYMVAHRRTLENEAWPSTKRSYHNSYDGWLEAALTCRQPARSMRKMRTTVASFITYVILPGVVNDIRYTTLVRRLCLLGDPSRDRACISA